MTTPAPPLPTRRWLTPDEAAAWLGYSRRQFDRAGFEASYRLGPGSPLYDVNTLNQEMRDGFSSDKEGQAGDDTRDTVQLVGEEANREAG